MATSKGVLKKGSISGGWWRRFIKRQNDLVLRKGDSTTYLRMDAVNDKTLKQHYDLLEDTLTENNLMSSPSCIYNVP